MHSARPHTFAAHLHCRNRQLTLHTPCVHTSRHVQCTVPCPGSMSPCSEQNICQGTMSLSTACMTLTPRTVTAPLSEASHPPSSPHPIKASFLFAACRLGRLLHRQHALPHPPIAAHPCPGHPGPQRLQPPRHPASSRASTYRCSYAGFLPFPSERRQQALSGATAPGRAGSTTELLNLGVPALRGTPRRAKGWLAEGTYSKQPASPGPRAAPWDQSTPECPPGAVGMGRRGASLHPFICLHMWGCFFFSLEVLLYLTPPYNFSFRGAVAMRRGFQQRHQSCPQALGGRAAALLLPPVAGKEGEGGGCLYVKPHFN